MIQFILNNQTIECHHPPGLPLLDFIRYHQSLTGTKIGCREGDCGACTVLIGELIDGELHYRSMTSCLVPLGNVHGKHIVTIEGVNFPGRLNMIQQAIAECGGTQCGFCTPGFIMSLTGFCLSNEAPTKENAIASIDGNICRCTGYKSIEKAAYLIADQLKGKKNGVEFVTQNNILPDYFSEVKEKLMQIVAASPDNKALKPETHIVAGGTDLYVQKHEELVYAGISFVFDSPAMNFIRKEGNTCTIGPSVTVSDLRNSAIINEAIPGFYKFSRLISSTPIRNMATIAGNFVNASPIGDMTIFFLALDASIELTAPSSGGVSKRTIPLRQFYKGYKQLDKRPDEIISSISFELPGKDVYVNFEKVSKRTQLDIASTNSAICLNIKGGVIEKARLSAGGVGPVPLYLQKTSEYLAGRPIGEKTTEGAVQVMKTEISPISDVRGSAAYKTLLLEQLIKAHLLPLISTR